jgi:hypothetical protein
MIVIMIVAGIAIINDRISLPVDAPVDFIPAKWPDTTVAWATPCCIGHKHRI